MGIWFLFTVWIHDDAAGFLAKMDKRLAEAKTVWIECSIDDRRSAGSHGGTYQEATACILVKGKKLNLSIQGTAT